MKWCFAFLICTFNSLILFEQGYAQWTSTNGPPGGYVWSLVVNETTLYAGTQHGLFSSTNYGATWNLINSGLPVVEIRSLLVNGANIFAGTWGKGIYLSTNNGESWNPANTGKDDPNTDAFTVIGSNMFAGGPTGAFRSTDNGTSWTAINAGLNSSYLIPYVKSLATDGLYLYAGLIEGGVYRSNDNGKSWTSIKAYNSNDDVPCLFMHGTDLFAVDYQGVSHTSDLGASWTSSRSPGIDTTGVSALAASGSTLFAGTYSGIFRSTNNGIDWIGVSTGLGNIHVFSLCALSKWLFAGTSDSIWQRPLAEIVTKVNSERQEPLSLSCLKQNFPNPFNPTTTIQFSLQKASFVTLKVFNLLGKEVAILLSDHLEAGTHSTQWNAVNIPSGVYFYRLQTGSLFQTKSLVVLK